MKKMGLIGCGRFGENHAKNLFDLKKTISDYEFIGIADPNSKVRETAQKYNVGYFSDYKELVDCVDAVTVVASTNLHYSIVKYALNLGKHVFVEKPAAETYSETKELVNLANSKELILNTGYLFRFNPAVQELKKRLNEAGNIRYIRATNIHERAARKDSGAIINLGVHPLDTLLFVTKREPVEVSCMTSGKPKEEKAAIINLNYSSYIGIIETACEAHGLVDKGIEVVGQDCTLKVDFLEQTLNKYVIGKPAEIWKPSTKVDLVKTELEHFVNCIKGENDLNVGKEDLLTAKICDAAFESAVERRKVIL